jgi:hypothetical protein
VPAQASGVYGRLSVLGAGDFIEVSSCFAAETAEPSLETTEKADKKVPVTVPPIAIEL